MITETILFKEISIFPELFLGISLVYLVLHGSFISMRMSRPLIQSSMVYLGTLVIFLSILLLVNDKLYVLELGLFNNTISNDYVGFSAKLVIGIISLICLLIDNESNGVVVYKKRLPNQLHPRIVSQRATIPIVVRDEFSSPTRLT